MFDFFLYIEGDLAQPSNTDLQKIAGIDGPLYIRY